MGKIKFMVDSAADITDSDLREYDIDMPSVPIVADGEEYFERKSFTIEEFYNILNTSKEIPVTSRVPMIDFLTGYQNAYRDGYTDVVCVTINAGGSGTNASAIMAKEHLYAEFPEVEERLRIHIVDSRTYSMAFGYPVVQAAKQARDGATVEDILAYLDDWVNRVEVLLGCYSLEYARKSGRIGAAAAFVGDVLGVRPIISMIDGSTKTEAKVRGGKLLTARILAMIKEKHEKAPEGLCLVCGENTESAQELQKMIQKEYGIKVPYYHVGASIAINAGPQIVAAIYLAEKRRDQ